METSWLTIKKSFLFFSEILIHLCTLCPHFVLTRQRKVTVVLNQSGGISVLNGGGDT